MTDREKVLKGLNQHCDGSMFDRCGECPYYKLANKPFECRDKLLEDVFTLLKKQPELVRCKDCKRKDTLSCPKAPVRPDDWYCADGERREDDG